MLRTRFIQIFSAFGLAILVGMGLRMGLYLGDQWIQMHAKSSDVEKKQTEHPGTEVSRQLSGQKTSPVDAQVSRSSSAEDSQDGEANAEVGRKLEPEKIVATPKQTSEKWSWPFVLHWGGNLSAIHGVCQPSEPMGYPPSVHTPSPAERLKWESMVREQRAAVSKWVSAQFNFSSVEEKDRVLAQFGQVPVDLDVAASDSDLEWHGVGAWIKTDSGEQRLQLGAGFRRWVEKNQRRARFELSRLLLQWFHPCEWKRRNLSLEVFPKNFQLDQESCEANSVAKNLWRFSSQVAAELAPPGCQFVLDLAEDRAVAGDE